MLLRDALDRGSQRAEIVDALGIGQDGGCKRLGLGAGLAVMRLVEESADLLVLEHALVHALRNRQPMLLEGGNGGLHEIDGHIAERGGHGIILDTSSWADGMIADVRGIGMAQPYRDPIPETAKRYAAMGIPGIQGISLRKRSEHNRSQAGERNYHAFLKEGAEGAFGAPSKGKGAP